VKGICALLSLICATSATADTLIDNVQGITATSFFGDVQHFSAILISDDGRVVRTYAAGEKVDFRPKYRVDGRGRVLLPGFVTSSSKVIETGLKILAIENGLSGPLPKPTPRDREAAINKAELVFLKGGYTSVSDMGTTVEDWLALRRAGDESRLRVRVFCYANGIAPMIAIGGGRVTPWLYNDHLRLAGTVIDGHIPNGKSPLGIKNDEARLRNEMSHAAMDGFQVAVSADTPAEIKRATAAMTELSLSFSGKWRWRLINKEMAIPPKSFFSQAYPLVMAHEAKTLLAGDKFGALLPGFLADFTLWAENPLENKSNDGPLETWVGGVKVYERKP
jgi:predicted amidohydrolase YtcJ